MKAIQVLFDEDLLARIDESEEVRHRGRSAVLRQAARNFLREEQSRRIAEAYRRGYAHKGIQKELNGWEAEGKWPEN